jgi:hypothetical protein
MDIAFLVSYSVLLLRHAQMPTSHVFSHLVSSITGSIGNLADTTWMYFKGCVSGCHSWGMIGFCVSCVVLGLVGWVC